jgi:hypothetical protein
MSTRSFVNRFGTRSPVAFDFRDRNEIVENAPRADVRTGSSAATTGTGSSTSPPRPRPRPRCRSSCLAAAAVGRPRCLRPPPPASPNAHPPTPPPPPPPPSRPTSRAIMPRVWRSEATSFGDERGGKTAVNVFFWRGAVRRRGKEGARGAEI